MHPLRKLFPLVAGSLSLALAACQSAPPAPSPATAPPTASAQPATTLSPEVQRLIAAAKANNENELDLSWSGTTMGGADGAKMHQDIFNKMFGLNAQFVFTPGPSMSEMSGKLQEELAAGQKASSDVYFGAETHYNALIGKGLLEDYDYTALSPRITSDMLAPDNMAVEISSRVPGITYNTNLVQGADIPHKLADLLDPKWTGKIVGTVDAAGFDAMAYRPEWTLGTMTDYVGKLSQQVSGLIRCGNSDRVASGELLMLAMDCGTYQARSDSAKGEPVASVIPDDAATVLFFYLSVPKNSAHPNLSTLFIDEVLTEEGQRVIYTTDSTDLYTLPGSQSAAELADLKAKGVEPLRVDVQFRAAHPGGADFSDQLAKILRGGSNSGGATQ